MYLLFLVTYRLDSDVFYLAGKLLDIDTNHVVAPVSKGLSVKWKKPVQEYNVSLEKGFKDKKRDIAQITSHCHPFSHSNVLVEKLRKYIDVHVYGQGKCAQYR
jgi:hypothetical protein